MKNLIKLSIGIYIVLSLVSCKDKNCVQDTACSMSPDPGDCLAAFPKYYYDPVDGNCKEFTWGGCGDYPFETLIECEEECNCK